MHEEPLQRSSPPLSSARELHSLIRRTAQTLGPKAVRRALLSLPHDQAAALAYDWEGVWARDKQLEPPGDWMFWLMRAGRSGGKTRAGSETVIKWAREHVTDNILIGGRTSTDVRSFQIEGKSGILKVSPPWFMPEYQPSKMRLVWPNGVIGTIRYGDAPNGFRGFEGGRAWLDELFHWGCASECWSNLLLGLREIGKEVGTKIVITSTPIPTPLMREVLADPDTVDVRWPTKDNRANVDPRWLTKMTAKWGGTRFGLQELEGEILEDCPGASWRLDQIAPYRVEVAPTLELIVVAVDPAMTEDGSGAETGIVVVGRAENGHCYVVEDATGVYGAEAWGYKVAELYRRWKANYVVAEINNGGTLVARNIHVEDPSIPIKTVHAKNGKRLRSEPVVALYGRGLVHHVTQGDPSRFSALEHQMTQVDPDDIKRSKKTEDERRDRYDRADALVYGVSFAKYNAAPGDASGWLDGYQ